MNDDWYAILVGKNDIYSEHPLGFDHSKIETPSYYASIDCVHVRVSPDMSEAELSFQNAPRFKQLLPKWMLDPNGEIDVGWIEDVKQRAIEYARSNMEENNVVSNWNFSIDAVIDLQNKSLFNNLKEIFYIALIGGAAAAGVNEAWLRTDAAEAAHYIMDKDPVLSAEIANHPHDHKDEIFKVLEEKYKMDTQK